MTQYELLDSKGERVGTAYVEHKAQSPAGGGLLT
jgi:hypothetical protein